MEKQEMLDALKEFKENLPTYVSPEDLENKMSEFEAKLEGLNMTDELKELKEAVEVQGLALKEFNTKTEAPKTVSEFLATEKDTLVGIVKNGSNKEIVVKADTYRANVLLSKVAYEVPDIGQLANRRLTLYDLFAKVPVGKDSGGIVSYYDWDEDTVVKAAAVIAEGGTFPENTAKWKWYSLPLVKVGNILPVSEEFETDMARFYAELGLFLQTDVDTAVDTQLYSGDGTGNNMTGVYTAADEYVASAQGITDASIYDLVVKMRTSIVAGTGGKYMPNFVLMNPTDIDKYKLKKDGNNNYVMPPFVSKDGKVIDGINVIETSAVTADTCVMGDNRFAKIYEVDGYSLTKGHATGDFEDDKFSLKAKRRLMMLVKNADKAGFAKETGIAAALVTLAS